MALQHGNIYAIRNELTHTVLDLSNIRGLFVKGCGWHGGPNQQWEAIAVGLRWQFRNLFENQHSPRRFLYPQPADRQTDGNFRLTGGLNSCDFEVVQVGQVEGAHRIKLGDQAVTLVTGEGVPGIDAHDQVLDLEADGPPIVLQPQAEANVPAQTWSFVRFIPPNVLHPPLLPSPSTQILPNGAYKIVNATTGTVLDVANTVGNPVHGVVSKGGNHHKWILSHYDGYFWIRHSSGCGRFLAPDVAEGDLPKKGIALIENYIPGKETTLIDDLPRKGTALIGHDTRGMLFLIKKAPNTDLYKIFLGPTNATLNDVKGLSVNLAGALDGAVVRLQQTRTDETQTWRFVK